MIIYIFVVIKNNSCIVRLFFLLFSLKPAKLRVRRGLPFLVFVFVFVFVSLLVRPWFQKLRPAQLHLRSVEKRSAILCICLCICFCICICCAIEAFVGHRWQCVPPGGVVCHWLWGGGAATNQPAGLKFAKNLPKYLG